MPDGRPDVAELLASGSLHPQTPDANELRAMLNAAEQDLKAAESIGDRFPARAEAILYEAGLRAARIVVMASGYRIAVERGHVTAIDAADALTEGRRHRLFVRLHRLRRRRHGFLYTAAPDPTTQELATARGDAAALIELARDAIRPKRGGG